MTDTSAIYTVTTLDLSGTLALVLSGLHMNLGLKFLVVAPVAMALCYMVAYYFRKIPIVRGIL